MSVFKFPYKTKIFFYLCFVVITITITVGGLFYYSVVDLIENETKNTDRNVIIQLRNATDIMLKQIDTLLNQVCLDYLVETYMDWNTEANYKEIGDFREKLSSTLSSCPYFTSGYIYYFGYPEIVDIKNKTLVRIEAHQDKAFIEKIIKISKGEKFEKSFKVYNIRLNSNPEELTLVKAIGAGGYEKRALLIMNLNKRYFDDVLNSIKIDKLASVFIVDGTGEIISQKNDKYSQIFNMRTIQKFNVDIQGKEGSLIDEFNGDKKLVTFVTADTFDWKFFYTIPTKQMYDKVYKIRIFLIILTVICIVLGFGAALILTEILYKPVKRIVNLLINTEKQKSEKLYDDIGYINQNINMLISKNKNMEELLAESMPELKSSLFRRMLKNEYIPSEPLWEKIRFYKANILENCKYGICIIGIDQYETFVSKYTEKQISMLEIYHKGIINNIFENEKEIGIEVFKKDTNELVILVSLKERLDEAGMQTDFLKIVNDLHEKLCESANHTITIGLGNFYNSVEDIYLSYNEARAALGYKVMKGKNMVISVKDIPLLKEIGKISTYEYEKAILSSLKEGNGEKLNDSVDAYFKYIKGVKVNYTDIKYILTNLLNSSLRFIMEMGIDINEIVKENKNLYNDLLQNETIDDASEWFIKFYYIVIDYINIKKDNKKDEIATLAIKFIEKNYASPNLDLDSISRNLHFSVSYLGKLFKDSTGETIKDYITRMRLEAAKRLLTESYLTVKEVAERVGYPVPGSFIKNFKNYVGDTPGEFREKHIKRAI